jgi:hypothetical protein
MKLKWYFGTLIIILALSGAIYQQQHSIANQEIAFQFSNLDHTSKEAQSAIVNITMLLEDFGVKNIQVKEEEGQLRIAYYSDVDVASIKKILSNENAIAVDYDSNNQQKGHDNYPIDKDAISYDLDVYEIQNGNDSKWDFDGKYVLELESKADRFFNPNVYLATDDINENENDSKIKVAYRINRSIAIAIDNTSHKIPEVRAGPAIKRKS